MLCRKEKLYEDCPITNFAIYISEPSEIGRVLDAMSYIGDGECTIKIVNDTFGNTCYCLTGWADDLQQLDQLSKVCVDKDIKAQFSY